MNVSEVRTTSIFKAMNDAMMMEAVRTTETLVYFN
jgi:hypothetical protein